jgi:hypothetical protein
MARGSQNLSLYLLVAAETVHSAPQFMPDLDTLAESPYDDKVRSVRRGELLGGAWTLLIALIISHATDSTVPLVIWLLTSAAIVAIYEFHLRKPA